MAEANRFSGLIGGLNQGTTNEPEIAEPDMKTEGKTTAEPKSKSKAKGEKSTAKSKDPSYTQIGVYLPNDLHRKMKIGAAMTGLEMSDLAAQAVELWLAENAPNI
jgi:hypothetical protein